MYLLYSFVLCACFVALLPAVAYQRLRHRKAVGRIQDRVGRLPSSLNPEHKRAIWIHAVSVGEVLASKALLNGLRHAYPTHRLLLSTTTVSGQHVAEGLGDAVDGTFYAPFDLSPFVTRALDRVTPDLLVLIDTEIWPNLLRACRRRGVKTVLVNGRMSERSYSGYRLARPFMRCVLKDLDRVCAQTELWGSRFVDLGFPGERLTVTGSLKFDALDVSTTSADFHVGDRALRCFQFARDRPVLIAASTLRGEEEPVLRAFARIRKTARDAVLIVAPRHPQRFDEACQIVSAHGFEVTRRTDLSPEGTPSECVVVLDTIGELPRLFQLATLVFVGGSLVPAGGHNILEPAVFGKTVVFGSHMENFAEIAELFLKHDAAWQVDSVRELEEVLVTLMTDPVRRAGLGAAARALVEANRGARQRSLSVVSDLLEPGLAVQDSDVRTLRVLP